MLIDSGLNYDPSGGGANDVGPIAEQTKRGFQFSNAGSGEFQVAPNGASFPPFRHMSAYGYKATSKTGAGPTLNTSAVYVGLRGHDGYYANPKAVAATLGAEVPIVSDAQGATFSMADVFVTTSSAGDGVYLEVW